MRTVKQKHFERLMDAVDAVAGISQRGGAIASDAIQKFESLMLAGQTDAAHALEAEAIAKSHVLLAEAGARLEIAASAFLGLKRQPSEGVNGYAARIFFACNDLSTILATQRENGIIFMP